MSADNHASLATLLYNDAKSAETDRDGLMEYLQHDYPHTDSGSDVAGHHARADHSIAPLPTPHRASQPPQNRFPDLSPGPNAGLANLIVRSPSPPNPDIPIPNSLARIATRTISSLDLPDPAVLTGHNVVEQAALLADFGDRGEMGGKRRKLPHQRAGWSEMDQELQGAKKRRTRKSDAGNQAFASAQSHAETQTQAHTQSTEHHGFVPAAIGTPPSAGVGPSSHANDAERGLSELSRMALENTIESGERPDERSAHGNGNGTGNGTGNGNPVDPSLAGEQRPAQGENNAQGETQDQPEGKALTPEPKSRAEQNKRAQQAFRRRREEHMKKLEMDSAQLVIVKRQSEQKDVLLRDAILTIESSKIEIAALQSALRNIIPHSAVSPFTPEGYLDVDEPASASGEESRGDELDTALGLLSRQAREAAKMSYGRK